MPARRLTALLLTGPLLLATLVTACSDGDTDAPPAGTRASDEPSENTTTVGPITLTVPAGWSEDPEAAERNEDASWVAPLVAGDSVPPQGIIVVTSKATGDVEQSLATHTGSMLAINPDFERGTVEDVDVPGAAGAKRVVWTIPETPDRPTGTYYDLLTVTDDGTQVLVRVATREPPTDTELANAVLDSVQVS